VDAGVFGSRGLSASRFADQQHKGIMIPSCNSWHSHSDEAGHARVVLRYHIFIFFRRSTKGSLVVLSNRKPLWLLGLGRDIDVSLW